MAASFLPSFPTRLFSRKSKRPKTTAPETLAPPPSIGLHSNSHPAPLRNAPANHHRSYGYGTSRNTLSSAQSAPVHGHGHGHGAHGDGYIPRKIPSFNDLQRPPSHPHPHSHTHPRSPPRPHAYPNRPPRDTSNGHTHRPARGPKEPSHQQLIQEAREREDAMRRRLSQQRRQQGGGGIPLSRSASLGTHALEAPWKGVDVSPSIEEESDSEEGPLDPVEVLEAFFNEVPIPEGIIMPPSPALPPAQLPPSQRGSAFPPLPPPTASRSPSTRARSPPTVTRSPPIGTRSPPPLVRPPPTSPPPSRPRSSARGRANSRSRTPQLHASSKRRPITPITPPQHQSAFDDGVGTFEEKTPSLAATSASPPTSLQTSSRSPFSLPRLRRSSSKKIGVQQSERPISRDEDLPYNQRPLPPTPPERGDSIRSRLLPNRRRSGEVPLHHRIQEDKVQEDPEYAIKQLSEALTLDTEPPVRPRHSPPRPRPSSIVAHIIPPEERAQIGRQRRGSMSSVSSMGESLHSPPPPILHSDRRSPASTSPFRLTFNHRWEPPVHLQHDNDRSDRGERDRGLLPPPRRLSMISNDSSNCTPRWSPPPGDVALASPTLNGSPVLQHDLIAQW